MEGNLNGERLEIKYVNPAELIPYENNPRKNDESVECLAESIRNYKFNDPIVVDENNVILAGHTRLKAALKLGMESVPVVVRSGLTEAQKRGYRIHDNSASENSQWDFTKLTDEMRKIRESNEIDIASFGFNGDVINKIVNGVEDPWAKDAPDEEGETDPDAIPDETDEDKSAPGCVYKLGRHRLACGDCTDEGLLSALFDGTLADLWLTDPPYNCAYTGGPKNAMRSIDNDSMDEESFRAFLDSSFGNAVAFLKPGAAYYIFYTHQMTVPLFQALGALEMDARQMLVWNKSSILLGRQDYEMKHEPFLYGWKPGAPHRWFNDACQPTVMDFRKASKSKNHPTEKPVDLLKYLIRNSSMANEIVFDGFAGSGSTLIACEVASRISYSCELKPKYCDTIRRRWAEFTHGEGCDWQALTPKIAEV